MRVLISIVTVTYNNSAGLRKTIESVRQQSYPWLEFIVIDGGSHDDSVNVIASNSDVISTWRSESDEGIYDAMNKGISLACGEWIIFMNAGDTFYNPQSLSRLFDLNTNVDADVLYGDHYVVDAKRRNGHRVALLPEHYHTGMICCHQSMLFNRTCFDERSFSCDFDESGDYEFLLYLLRSKKRLYKIDEIVSVFTGGGVSDTNRVSTVKNGIKALRANDMLGFRSALGFSWLYFRAILFQLYSKFESSFLKGGSIN